MVSDTKRRQDELLATASALVRESAVAGGEGVAKRRRAWLVTLAVLAVLVLAGVATVSRFGRSQASDAESSDTSPSPASQPAVEAASTAAPVASAPPDSAAAPVVPDTVATTEAVTTEAAAVPTTAAPAPTSAAGPTTSVEASTTVPVTTLAAVASRVSITEGEVARFTFEIEPDGMAYMRGSLPDEATVKMVKALGEAIVGADRVVDETTLDPRVTLDPEESDEGFVTQTLLYPSGVSGLAPAHPVELDAVAELLKANPGVVALVEGYADSQGPDDENLALSRSRARRVAEYLTGHGVDPLQIVETVGKGEADPRGDNATEAGRALNRRVDIHLTQRT